MKIYYNKSFKELTSINAGGIIKSYIEIENIKELEIIKNYEVIGNGTNILASSKYYDNTLIRLKTSDFFDFKNDKLTVNASMNLSKLIKVCANMGFYNLTRLYMIPASVGGAIIMNAGAFNDEISNHLDSILVYDNGFKTIKKEEIKFGYRKSNIKGVIVEATFNVFKGVDKRDFIKDIRIKTQPVGKKTFGSVFKNFNKIHAYQIIDMLSLRGYKIGDALISNKHANFIINEGNAKSEDILQLIELIKLNAYSRFDLEFECEVKLINF